MATYAPAYSAPYQNYVPRQPPPNWVPPPFKGPPPIPTGISVNPQQWQAGFWKPNPAWNGARPTATQQQPQQQHALWIPSQHWTHKQQQQQQPQQPQQQAARSQQPQQQPANFNPYKRVIQPPSAEYLATKLSDNPLGLINMTPVSTEEYYKQGQPEQHTPWIWNPANLEDDDDEDSSSPSHNRRNNSESESFTSQVELKPTFSPSIVRTPDHYRDSPSPTSRRGSRGSIDSALSTRMANLSTNKPPSLSRHSTMPSFSSSSSPSKPDFAPPIMFLSDEISDEPDSILSPLVLNTPKPLPQSALRNTVRNHHPNPILTTQSLDTIPETPASHFYNQPNNSSLASVNATPKGRGRDVASNTHPNPPKSPVANLAYQQSRTRPSLLPRAHTDWEAMRKEQERETEHRERAEHERERIEREQQRREHRDRIEQREQRDRIGSRHTVTTYVEPLNNTTTTSPGSHNNPGSSRPSPTSRPSSRTSSAHPSPTQHANNTPPRRQTTPPQQAQASGLTSPSTTHNTRTSNPLPPPPQPSNRIPTTSTTSTSSRYHPPPQLSEPANYIYKVRHGFWNRRGDHLTPDGYLVYAPPHLANPDDLKVYPLAGEGYMDHDGLYTAWCLRPELPASLPRMGKEADLPYEKFVVWDYK